MALLLTNQYQGHAGLTIRAAPWPRLSRYAVAPQAPVNRPAKHPAQRVSMKRFSGC